MVQQHNRGMMIGKNVLVVDDSAAQRRVLAGMLGRWGYCVREAASGDQALALCRAEMPDLVLSDWMMPGLPGPAFCKAFRQLDQQSYRYFILLTSKSDSRDIAEGLNAGADDFLSKPVNSHELRARLSAGQRLMTMQRTLEEKNTVIAETLAKLQGLYGELDRDLRAAKRLQQSLVPQGVRQFDGGALTLMLRSSGHLGGDLVGYYSAGPAQLGIFALDVSGHGISSALMTARLAGYLSMAAPNQNVALCPDGQGGFRLRGVQETIGMLNDLVLSEMDTDHYFTLMLAHIDLDTGRVQIGQAGHPHPIVLRLGGTLEQDGAGGFPVGLLPQISVAEQAMQLGPGDRLVILSDGVTECAAPCGALLGEAGLARLIAPLAQAPLDQLFPQLQTALEGFAASDEFPDDVSGALFEYRGPDQAAPRP